jgi:hypothetical protein
MTADEFIARVHEALAPDIRDGSEAHKIAGDLMTAVRDADDNANRLAEACYVAKRRLRALLTNLVPIDAVDNVVGLIWEQWDGGGGPRRKDDGIELEQIRR